MEAARHGTPVEVSIPPGKESVFVERIAKIRRVAADLTAENENYRNQRVAEIRTCGAAKTAQVKEGR